MQDQLRRKASSQEIQEKYKVWRLKRKGFLRNQAKHTAIHYKAGGFDILEHKVGEKRKTAFLNNKSKRAEKGRTLTFHSCIVPHLSTEDIVTDVPITMPIEKQRIELVVTSFHI